MDAAVFSLVADVTEDVSSRSLHLFKGGCDVQLDLY